MANERMKIQVMEKDKTIQSLQRNVNSLEVRQAADQTENETAKVLREETEELHAALRYLPSQKNYSYVTTVAYGM